MPIRVDDGPHFVVRPQQHDSTKALREKAAEFEGILLSEILQKMSDCYKVPGADDTDATGESFQSFASSALGGGLARSGGVGIGEMLADRSVPSGPTNRHPKADCRTADKVQKRSSGSLKSSYHRSIE